MGFVVDSFTFLPSTVCSAGLTTGTATFSGADFDRIDLRIDLTAQAGTWTTTGLVAVMFQNSSDGGTTWFPNAAGIAAAGYASASTVPGYQPLFTAGTTPVVGKYTAVANTFPGTLFRVGVYVVTGTSVTCSITGDCMKRVPDNA